MTQSPAIRFNRRHRLAMVIAGCAIALLVAYLVNQRLSATERKFLGYWRVYSEDEAEQGENGNWVHHGDVHLTSDQTVKFGIVGSEQDFTDTGDEWSVRDQELVIETPISWQLKFAVFRRYLAQGKFVWRRADVGERYRIAEISHDRILLTDILDQTAGHTLLRRVDPQDPGPQNPGPQNPGPQNPHPQDPDLPNKENSAIAE